MAAAKPVLLSRYQNSAGERVRIALALKNIDYDYVAIADYGRDRYNKLNPQGLMPALMVGDQVIIQSTAILEYFEELHPQPALLPLDPVLRARARAFGQIIASELHALTVGRVRRYLQQLPDMKNQGAIDQGAVEQQWLEHWYRQGFNALEMMLQRRQLRFDFCYGPAPGWADLFLAPQARNAERFGFPLGDYPLLYAIYRKCLAHPAFIAAAPENQTDFPDP